MLQFGEVDAVHMGDRHMGDRADLPIVRFKGAHAAEAALNAIKAGSVFLDGSQIQAEARTGGGGGKGGGKGGVWDAAAGERS